MKETLIEAHNLLQSAINYLQTADYKNCISAATNAAKVFENHQQWKDFVQIKNILIKSHFELLQYEKAKQQLEELKQHIPSKLANDSEAAVDYFNNWGDYFQVKNDFSQALSYYQNAYNIRQVLCGENTPEMADSYNRIGRIWGQKGEFEKELSCYRKALNISQKNWGDVNPFTAKGYQNMAGVYGVKGDYDTQLIYLQKALNICTQSLDIPDLTTASVLDSIGRSYAMKEDFHKALKFHRKALTIREKLLSEFHQHLADSYFHIAYCLQSLQQFEEALEEYKKSRRIREKMFGRNDASVAACYNNMGVCFGHLRMFFRQFDYHQKALEILLKIFGIHHHEVAFTYNQLGNCWQRRNFHVQALQQFQFALISLVDGFESANIYHNPRLKNYVVTFELLNAFSNKAVSLLQYYQENSRSKKDLRRAMVTFQVALELIDQKRHSFQSEHSKLDLINRFMPVYEGAIQTALELHRLEGSWQYLRAAFTLAEKGKSILLLSSIKDLEAKGIANIPTALMIEEKELRQQIVNLEKSIYQEQSIEEQANELRMSKLQNHLFDYQQKYRDLIENLEQQYPAYYQLKYEFEVLDVKELQETLQRENENNAHATSAKVLEYFVGEENIYIFLITAETLQYYIVAKPEGFEKMVRKMVKTINQLHRQKFIQIAHQLYQLLFPLPLHKELQINISNDCNKLYIIPDASLFYLPFEALLFEETNSKRASYSNLPYLIQRFAISYHYSTTLLYNSLQKRQENVAPSYVGFAPVYGSDPSKISSNRGAGEINNEVGYAAAPKVLEESLPAGTLQTCINREYQSVGVSRAVKIDGKIYHELVHTEEEVKAVQQLFRGRGFAADGYFHEDASIPNFLQQIAHCKFIHIAAHGIFNKKYPEYSGIVFSVPKDGNTQDAVFYIADAYSLQLQADLVVLSSCESGIGKLSKSEGMMAMNRALLYAGSNNVIFTLFKVYDESASRLTYLIFEGIVNHQLSYSQALQCAKQELIKEEMATPKSWSGFVLLGG
ncbi:MAG: CHAT domain-containing tetratricopeptide repeat protein [Chitinophagales bacterium]